MSSTPASAASSAVDFVSGERVLCYEPDPTKVRVVYDARILRVEDDDEVGEGSKFLVHFQGWNSSWDRFVSREFLLKDNEDSRRLQRELFGLQAEVIANKKKRKKKAALAAAAAAEGADGAAAAEDATDAGVPGTPEEAKASPPAAEPKEKVAKKAEEATKPKAAAARRKSKSEDAAKIKPDKVRKAPVQEEEEEESEEEEVDDSPISVPLSDGVKALLNFDHSAVNSRGRLHRLPAAAGRSIAALLEGFVRAHALERLATHERQYCRGGGASGAASAGLLRRESARENLERVLGDINVAKEVAEGLRVLADFYLGPLLLYGAEREQHRQLMEGKNFEDYYSTSSATEEKPNPAPAPAAALAPPPPPPSVFSRLRRSASAAPSDATASEHLSSSGRSSPTVTTAGGGGGGSTSTAAAATVAATTVSSLGGNGGGLGTISGGGDTALTVQVSMKILKWYFVKLLYHMAGGMRKNNLLLSSQCSVPPILGRARFDSTVAFASTLCGVPRPRPARHRLHRLRGRLPPPAHGQDAGGAGQDEARPQEGQGAAQALRPPAGLPGEERDAGRLVLPRRGRQ